MPLITLPRHCWTFTCTGNTHDHANPRTHSTQHSWLQLARECDRPYQLNSPCSYGYCDSCGIDYHHLADPRDAQHFPTPEAAAAELLSAGWTSAGHTWHCPNCPAFLALTPDALSALHAA